MIHLPAAMLCLVGDDMLRNCPEPSHEASGSSMCEAADLAKCAQPGFLQDVFDFQNRSQLSAQAIVNQHHQPATMAGNKDGKCPRISLLNPED
jgi:hypothetical protein